MATPKRSKGDRTLVKDLVDTYGSELEKIDLFRTGLLRALAESSTLKAHVHSMKSRLKDPGHLRDKLFRKMDECRTKGEPFGIDKTNLLTEINDLAGIRILHLYTRQIREINAALNEIIKEQQYGLREGPFARTWDDESRDFFKACGIETQESKSLYTSVHYVLASNSRTVITCELQVRTLSEELWGEVEHLINYPHPSRSVACREQLRVLARVTSSASRLVDAIFLTHEHEQRVARAARRRSRGSVGKRAPVGPTRSRGK